MQDIYGKYLLESTNDKTDVTEVIEKMLREYSVCILGTGEFYVSGVDMPDGATLMGLGHGSKIVLAEAVNDGYAVKMGSNCTVKDLSFFGHKSGITLPEVVGTRHGVVFGGTASTSSDAQPRNSIVTSCFMTSFEGGGITCVDTGYSTVSSITASNCHITNCGAGINIPFFSEYHEFTNMLCAHNLYGCINNGGNNVFVNCGFNSNKIGFLIDNSEGQSKNNSHGSVVGCTFNHSDRNNGIGIKLLRARYGYVFTGCQMGYSEIFVENSTNILFSAFNFVVGSQKIHVHGGKLVMFSDCMFCEQPTLSIADNESVIFSDCYTADGIPVNK